MSSNTGRAAPGALLTATGFFQSTSFDLRVLSRAQYRLCLLPVHPESGFLTSFAFRIIIATSHCLSCCQAYDLEIRISILLIPFARLFLCQAFAAAALDCF